jgi:hypothetical protein
MAHARSARPNSVLADFMNIVAATHVPASHGPARGRVHVHRARA